MRDVGQSPRPAGRQWIRWWIAVGSLFLLSGCVVRVQAEQRAPVLEPVAATGIEPVGRPRLLRPLPVHTRQNSVRIAGQSVPIESGQLFSLGQSVEGRELLAYRFGNGPVFVALLGGMHGSYEANTVTLAGQLAETLKAAPHLIPAEVSVFVIPVINPDGYVLDGMTGRVNAHQVDLNRNWGCKWVQARGTYRGHPFHTGSEPFSEPETRAVRDFLVNNDFKVAVFYHSQGAVVFYGECESAGPSRELAEVVSQATGYQLVDSDTHPVSGEKLTFLTGEAANDLDRLGIAAIDVELSSHAVEETDWPANYRGLLAIMAYAAGLADP